MSTRKTVRTPDRQIIALARLVLVLLTSTSNILIAIEELKKIFPRLKLKVVDDEVLPDVEARAYPKRWTIRIRRGIYEGLIRGRSRGRWTLVHELGHVLLQHRGNVHARQRERARGNRAEKEANIFARSVLAPFDRYADSTPEQIRSESGISSESAGLRVIEFTDAKERLAALRRHGLDIRSFTSEFGHQAHLERQAAIVAWAMSGILDKGQEENSRLVGPINENLFSTAVAVAAGSGLLLSAYESVRRGRASSNFIAPAALALTILTLCPIRPLGTTSKKGTPNSNMKCAMTAALRLAALPNDGLELPHFMRGENRHEPYECHFLKKLEKLSVEMIPDASAVLTLEGFPTYEVYNADHDIGWDDVHEIEYLADYFYVLSQSSRR